MFDKGCNDPDCELHNMQAAVEEGVATDLHRAAWLAGVEWALVQQMKSCVSVLEDAQRIAATNL